MKLFFTLSALFCFLIIGFGQYPKWIIQFTDKNNSPYSINNPSAYLSQKAIEKRSRYNIAIDSTDLPVNPNYIQQVIAKGNVSFLSESKWLNQILIYCTDTAVINSINSLPFVKISNAVGYFTSPHNKVPYDRFKEKIEQLEVSSSLINTTAGDTLNYGASSN